jgi:predicted Zn-dependent peptidase
MNIALNDNSRFHVQEIRDSLTGKKMRTWRHRSGLVVKILPRPGFSRKFAAVTVPYGSVNQSFEFDGVINDVPAGAAHFLEHCIFSRDDQGGLLGRLSSLGASANAYTTHTHTLYYFSAVSHFEQALDLYFKAVLKPYLETDRVEAERPVILAELSQYMDDPDNRCYMRLLENLYHSHPVRQDIGGTIESVSGLTSENLKQIHKAYYQPGSLTLTLAGDLDEKAIFTWLDTILADQPGLLPKTLLPAELPEIVEHKSNLQMDISAESFLIGVKDPGVLPSSQIKGLNLIERQRTARIVLDTLLSPAAELFESMYADGLINDSFGYHYTCENSFAFLVAGGESPRPEAAAETLVEKLTSAIRKGIDPAMFEIQKRAAAGDFVRSLDAVEHSGMVQARCNLHNVDLFDYPMLYDRMEAEAAVRMLSFLTDPANYAISILTRA